MEMIIRPYKSEDCDEIIQLFYDTIHTVNLKDYNQKQLDVWAPIQSDKEKWNTSLLLNHNVIVETNRTIVGFGDIDDTGYFNRLYIHKDYQRQGVATKIAQEVEKYAQIKAIKVITTEASITAKGFFEKRGYQVISQQSVKRGNQELINFMMKKHFK